jgi:hypothetical protein
MLGYKRGKETHGRTLQTSSSPVFLLCGPPGCARRWHSAPRSTDASYGIAETKNVCETE